MNEIIDAALGLVQRQLEEMRDAARGAQHFTDGRTVAGRRARLIDKHLTRLLEDLADLGAFGHLCRNPWEE